MFSYIHKNCRCLLSWSRGFPRRGAAAAAPRVIVTECRRFAAFGITHASCAISPVSTRFYLDFVAPIFVGALALGTETGLWYSTHEKMQGAANSSAISAAVGLTRGDTIVMAQAQAKATAASPGYGFVHGSSGTVVTVNKPPLSGPNVATPGAVEVIVTQPQNLLFASKWLTSPVVVQARAVAGQNPR